MILGSYGLFDFEGINFPVLSIPWPLESLGTKNEKIKKRKMAAFRDLVPSFCSVSLLYIVERLVCTPQKNLIKIQFVYVFGSLPSYKELFYIGIPSNGYFYV
jgi:hypothetical protein